MNFIDFLGRTKNKKQKEAEKLKELCEQAKRVHSCIENCEICAFYDKTGDCDGKRL